MDHKLLDILVCPICKGRLQINADKSGLICRADNLVFPIDDGIPIMLESQAKPLETEAGANVGKAS
ncbi:MAG: Trm112 family protein [Burkholderiaceae bacterium]|nr:Trm112 family protein [Burkholderiaceae bacterium]MCD8516718.1 Trm112 family protein [Burkholderiaceae bacterium]MCD8536616.1 Trm112 family protein [Burkholderiaceae bacterium]MCD8565156.1 Trm112 family protein [Burkholderiaceae bacterium]